MRWVSVVLIVLAIVPGWSGQERLALLDRDAPLKLTPVGVPPGARRAGRLTLVGAVALASPAPAFGGFSAIAVRGGRVLLLDDGGNWVSFGLAHGRARDARSGYLAAGPGTGWRKADRDSESLALDPARRTVWIGYERANQIWRYTAGRPPRAVAPAAMRDWRNNGGPESLVRLADGRFLAIAETSRWRGVRAAVLFDGDPVDPRTRARPLGYRPPPGTVASDAALLPSGDLVVLNRRWRFPFTFSTVVAIVKRGDIRPGRVMRARPIATLATPLLGENAEGVAVTRERGVTMLWIVTDNDRQIGRATHLMKFRLD